MSLRHELIVSVAGEVQAWLTPPLHASIFGSFARGEGTVDSDIDILLLRPAKVREEDEPWRPRGMG